MMEYRSLPRNCESGKNASSGGPWIALAVVLALVSIGCSESGTPLGLVEGVVTLDGKPLPMANLEFQPEGGSPSYARTDQDGHYEMQYSSERDGVAIGKHKVMIYTFRVETSPEGRPIPIPETLPARYHEASDMVEEVVAGRQKINFDLSSSP